MSPPSLRAHSASHVHFPLYLMSLFDIFDKTIYRLSCALQQRCTLLTVPSEALLHNQYGIRIRLRILTELSKTSVTFGMDSHFKENRIKYFHN